MVDDVKPTDELEAPPEAKKRRSRSADPEPEKTREELGLSVEHPKGDVVLRWLGGPDPVRFIQGVPADDLDADEVAHLIYRDPRTLRLERDDEGFPAARDRFVEELVG